MPKYSLWKRQHTGEDSPLIAMTTKLFSLTDLNTRDSLHEFSPFPPIVGQLHKDIKSCHWHDRPSLHWKRKYTIMTEQTQWLLPPAPPALALLKTRSQWMGSYPCWWTAGAVIATMITSIRSQLLSLSLSLTKKVISTLHYAPQLDFDLVILDLFSQWLDLFVVCTQNSWYSLKLA